MAILGVGSLLIAIFTLLNLLRTLITTKNIQRAYIDLSPKPPGLHFKNDRDRIVPIISVGLKNAGQTPGTVLNVGYSTHLGPSLPTKPRYNKVLWLHPSEYVVMPHEGFVVEPDDMALDSLSLDEATDVMNGRQQLWVIGYVEYADKFGRKFRTGHARIYARDKDVATKPDDKVQTMNVELQPGYNYDRRIGWWNRWRY